MQKRNAMGTSKGWIEKRQHERVVATVKVDFRLVDAKDSKSVLENVDYKNTTVERLPELSHKSSLYHAVTKDISLGGLALLGDQAFPVGAVVEIGLHLPQYQAVLKFLARVVRAESFIEMGRTIHRAGVQTIAINQDDLNRIEQYLINQAKKNR
jgi:hypothetical protein